MSTVYYSLIKQACLVILLFFLTMLTVEGILRLKSHLEVGIKTKLDHNGLRLLEPGVSKIIQGGAGKPIKISTNHEGFASHEAILGDSSNYRLAFLGNSFTMGFEVNQDKKFSSLVGEKLNGMEGKSPDLQYEVLNFGESNFGAVEQLILMREYVTQYQPDLTILTIYPVADFANTRKFLADREYLLQTPLEELDSKKWFQSEEVEQANKSLKNKLIDEFEVIKVTLRLINQNQTLSELAVRLGILSPKLTDREAAVYFDEIESYLLPSSTAHEEVRQFTSELIVKLGQEIKNHGGKFMVVIIPTHLQVDDRLANEAQQKYSENFDRNLPNRVIVSEVKQAGFLVLDLTDVISRAINIDQKQVYVRDIGHLTAFGHELAATEITKFLKENRITKF